MQITRCRQLGLLVFMATSAAVCFCTPADKALAAEDAKRPSSRVTASGDDATSPVSPSRPVVTIVQRPTAAAKVVERDDRSSVDRSPQQDLAADEIKSAGSDRKITVQGRGQESVQVEAKVTSKPAAMAPRRVPAKTRANAATEGAVTSSATRVAATPKKKSSPRRPATLHGTVAQPDEIKRAPEPRSLPAVEADVSVGRGTGEIPSASPSPDQPVSIEPSDDDSPASSAREALWQDDGITPLPPSGTSAPVPQTRTGRGAKPQLEQPRSLGPKSTQRRAAVSDAESLTPPAPPS